MLLFTNRGVAVAVCVLGAACLLGSILVPSLMKVGLQSERVKKSATQELKNFNSYLETYKLGHGGKLPPSFIEFAASTGYLDNLTEAARIRKRASLQYPVDPRIGGPGRRAIS